LTISAPRFSRNGAMRMMVSACVGPGRRPRYALRWYDPVPNPTRNKVCELCEARMYWPWSRWLCYPYSHKRMPRPPPDLHARKGAETSLPGLSGRPNHVGHPPIPIGKCGPCGKNTESRSPERQGSGRGLSLRKDCAKPVLQEFHPAHPPDPCPQSIPITARKLFSTAAISSAVRVASGLRRSGRGPQRGRVPP